MSRPLEGVKVLEFVEASGVCGRIFADLGASVTTLRLQSPVGGIGRAHRLSSAGHPADERHREWVYNLGKSIYEVDLATENDATIARSLALRADVVIDDLPPRTLDGPGLSYADVSATNTGVVYTSVSPFGQTGPKADWAANDLILMASGGLLFCTGDDDRPPVVIGAEQSGPQAGAQAALATLLAYVHRLHTGIGQYIDVSGQEAVTNTLNNVQQQWARHQRKIERGHRINVRGVLWRDGYPCKDGHVAFRIFFGPRARRMRPLLSRLADEFPAATIHLVQFETSTNEQATQEMVDDWDRQLTAFFQRHTKSELFEWSVREGIMLYPVSSPAELLLEEQLLERQAFVTLPRGDGDSREVPRSAFRATSFDSYPTAAEYHGPEQQIPDDAWKEPSPVFGADFGTSSTSQVHASSLPLDGLTVIDFGWAIAGPVTGKYLAMFGANVIKVESSRRIDGTRGRSVNKSTYFANHNVSKKSVTLDLGTENGRQIAYELADRADIVLENFTAGQMSRWGLDFESISQRNPGVIYVSSSAMGQIGPKAQHPGFGSLLQAFAGINYVTGWPDRDPVGPKEPYPDMIAPWYSLLAILSALLRRSQSGEGCNIDVSQLEATLQFIAPALLRPATGGDSLEARHGNRSATQCPHGVFPTANRGEWIAVAVLNDAMWQDLVSLMRNPDLKDSRYDEVAARLDSVATIEGHLSRWTATLPGPDLEKMLQGGGIAASVVQDGQHLHADEQLAWRQHFVTVDHPLLGPHPVDGPSFRLSALSPRISPAPLLGQDTESVLSGMLGYDEQRIEALKQKEILV